MNDTSVKKTHVVVGADFTNPIGRIELNSDDIGYAEMYDFSRANMSEESRIAAISTVASVCYQNSKALGSISLYNRLLSESAGLPSSSFEFVPVLINTASKRSDLIDDDGAIHLLKYGEILEVESQTYLLTNLRALIAVVGDDANQFYNTEEECRIIAKHHKVFKTKIDLATARQFMRHRVIWQELSRRYVSGSKSSLEFYLSPKMIDLNQRSSLYIDDENSFDTSTSTKAIIDLCVQHYNYAIANGVKPEEARRVLPQSMYTTIWSAWMPKQFDSFIKLRTDSHTQSEHRELANAMLSLDSSRNLI
jgi:thymidylate synthase (FAD)